MRDEFDSDDSPRPRRKARAKQKVNPALLWGLIGGGAGFLIILIIVLVVVTTSGGVRDPKFDQIKKGMSEDEVVRLLGKTAWTYRANASGVWTYPRMKVEDIMNNPDRNREIQDVIFVYFNQGKVINIYRKTGEEFRQPRPR